MTVEDWAEIRRLHAQEQLSIRAIAKHLGIARDTVARAVVAQWPPQYVRPPVVSRFDAYELRVRELLKDFPAMPAMVIAERVGWDGSPSWFRKRVAGLRVDYAPRDPADRLEYRPEDQARCDLWFPPVKIALGPEQCGTPPVLVFVSSYSRFITAMMLPSRTTGDLLAGMWELMSSQLGVVPHRLIWDNEAGIGRRNRYAEGVAGFCGTLATRIVQLRPFDPESKGIVERADGYLESSLLPGWTFTSPADFNTQLGQWLPVANRRIVRRLGARPVELAGIDRAAMLALPPVPPATGFSARVRLPRAGPPGSAPRSTPTPCPASPTTKRGSSTATRKGVVRGTLITGPRARRVRGAPDSPDTGQFKSARRQWAILVFHQKLCSLSLTYPAG